MAFKPTSKVAVPSRTSWSPPRTKTHGQPKCCHILVPMLWPRLWWWIYRGTSRTFRESYKEHLKGPWVIYHHSSLTAHPTNHNNFQIIGREGHNLARNIKESIFIRVNNPTLNNNIDKFNLPHIWNRVLLNTPGLNLKRQVNNNNTQPNSFNV